MSAEVSAWDELFHGIFTTALEGGINYWASCSHYRWSRPNPVAGVSPIEDWTGFRAVIVAEDYADEDLDRTIDRAVIARGYGLATSPEWRNRISWSSGERPPLVVTDDSDWDFDAGDADVIVQLGLFGELVYG